MKEFVLGVMASMLASIILAIVVLGREAFSLNFRRIKTYWSVTKRFGGEGIINFFAKRSDYMKYRKAGTIAEYIRGVERELIYVGFWLSHGIEMTNIEDVLRELLEKGCYIEFVFTDPHAPHVKSLAQFFSQNPESIAFKIQDSIDRMVSFRNRLPQNLKPRFVIMTHRNMISASTFMIDHNTHNGKTLVDFKLYQMGRDESFGIEFQGRLSKASLHYRIVESFQKVRKSAKIIP